MPSTANGPSPAGLVALIHWLSRRWSSMTAGPDAPYWIVGRATLLEAELTVGEDAGDAEPPTVGRRLPAATEVVDGLGRVTVAEGAGHGGSEVDERAILTG